MLNFLFIDGNLINLNSDARRWFVISNFKGLPKGVPKVNGLGFCEFTAPNKREDIFHVGA